MPEQSIIVWDLETIPDLAAAARMLDMGNACDAEVREALGTGFPKHPLHKIACIGALIASRQPEALAQEAEGAGDRVIYFRPNKSGSLAMLAAPRGCRFNTF